MTPSASTLETSPLFTASHDAMLLLDGQGRLLAANAAARRLLERDTASPPDPPDSPGGALDDLLDDPPTPEALRDAARRGDLLDWRCRAGQGRRIRVQVRLSWLEPAAEDGEAGAVLLACLRPAPGGETAPAMPGLDALAGLSHELRTPLNSIMGLAQLLMESGAGPESRDYLTIILHNARQLLKVVNLLLDLSTLEQGRALFLDMPFSARPLLAEVEKQHASLARHFHIQVRCQPGDGLPDILRGDQDRVRQLLCLLLDLALLDPHPGDIDVRVDARPGEAGLLLRLDLHDRRPEAACWRQECGQPSGEGWSPAGGLARLHLTVADRLARHMGGSLTCETEPGPQGGCRAVVLLPLLTPALSQDVPPLPPPPAGVASSEAWRVLLVEDEPVNRLLVEKLLARRGHEVTGVESGEAMLRLLERETPDVLLMDLHLPGINGLEAARRVRSLPGAAGETPIVALTIFASPADRDACEAAGMDGYVVKPFDTESLLWTIRLALEKRKPRP